MTRRGSPIFSVLVILFSTPLTAVGSFAYGQTSRRSEARVIYYGQQSAPGVVSAVEFRSGAVSNEGPIVPSGSRTTYAGGSAAPNIPAPVALSAHNCVPRTDSRGISLSFSFYEAPGGDCISFVSPEPVESRDQRPNRRRPRRPSSEQLAQRAFDRVISLAARPRLEVAPGRIGLTGLPSYFWVGNELRSVTATAGVPGLTVTAEARPVQFLWDFGDGATRSTRHGGRAWTPTQNGNVGHLYETKGRYEVSVEVVWAARWRVNRGPWQDLGYFSTIGSTAYPVREMISVLVRRR